MMHGTRVLFGYANSRETQELASSDLYTFYESPLDRIHFLWSGCCALVSSQSKCVSVLQSPTTVDEISRWMMTVGAATFYTTTTDRKTELLLLGGVRHALQLLLVLPPRNIQHYYYYYYCPRSSPRPLSLCCCGVRSFDGGSMVVVA